VGDPPKSFRCRPNPGTGEGSTGSEFRNGKGWGVPRCSGAARSTRGYPEVPYPEVPEEPRVFEAPRSTPGYPEVPRDTPKYGYPEEPWGTPRYIGYPGLLRGTSEYTRGYPGLRPRPHGLITFKAKPLSNIGSLEKPRVGGSPRQAPLGAQACRAQAARAAGGWVDGMAGEKGGWRSGTGVGTELGLRRQGRSCRNNCGVCPTATASSSIHAAPKRPVHTAAQNTRQPKLHECKLRGAASSAAWGGWNTAPFATISGFGSGRLSTVRQGLSIHFLRPDSILDGASFNIDYVAKGVDAETLTDDG
jgi:hypothetical protein